MSILNFRIQEPLAVVCLEILVAERLPAVVGERLLLFQFLTSSLF